MLRWLLKAWYFLFSIVISWFDEDAADHWYLARLRELEEKK